MALTEKERSQAENPRSRQVPNVAQNDCRRNRIRESRPARAARYSEALMIVGVMSAPVW